MSTTYPLTIRLFGAFETLINGDPLPRLRSKKGQWLLALLVLNQGSAKSRDWLAGRLWPESLDTEAKNSLRRSLTDLRQALGSESGRILSPTPRSLSLDLIGTREGIDVVMFDELVARGDRASLEEAVSLHRGPLLEGCEEEWVFEERKKRQVTYMQTLENLAARAIGDDDLASAVYYRQMSVRAEPLHEPALQKLMQILKQSARYTEAIEAFQEYRNRIHASSHQIPLSETVQLFDEIRDIARTRVTTIAKPMLDHPVLPRRPLPPPQPILGREHDIREIRASLILKRLITLVGIGGIGKTELVKNIAFGIADDFADGAYFIDLSSLTVPAHIRPAIATSVGTREEILTDFLHSKKILLILDNCEHLAEECAQVAKILLEASHHLRILATSRVELGLRNYEKPHLVNPLTHQDAVRLFAIRAQQARPSFEITRGNEEAVMQICRQLEGIPLAIELAAALVKGMSTTQIVERLIDKFHLLVGDDPTKPARHQTLWTMIDSSYQLLSETETALLRRVAVFAGGWTLEAAEAVCACEQLAKPSIALLLRTLASQSLVVIQELEDGIRYNLLETIREYVLEKTRLAGEYEEVLQHHLDFYQTLAEEIESNLYGHDPVPCLKQLELELDNLRVALGSGRWIPDGTEQRLFLASVLFSFWDMRGHQSEGLQWLKSLLAESKDKSTLAQALALLAAGGAAYHQGEYEAAQSFYESALSVSRELSETSHMATARNGLGLVAYSRGVYSAARSHHEGALALRKDLGNLSGVANSLNNLGNVAREQGDYETARACHMESLAIRRSLDEDRSISISLYNLGDLERYAANYAVACSHYAEALEMSEILGDAHTCAYIRNGQGIIARVRGNYADALALHEQSLADLQRIDEKMGIAISLYNLGLVLSEIGQSELAHDYILKALDIREKASHKRGMAECFEALACIKVEQGDVSAGIEFWSQAVALREAIGAPLPPLMEPRLRRSLGNYVSTLPFPLECAPDS